MQSSPLSEDEILYISGALLAHYELLFPELDSEIISAHINAGLSMIGEGLEKVTDIRISGMLPGEAGIGYNTYYV